MFIPLKSHIRGPAPASDQDSTDIVDLAITFFRANVFFRNFDIKSSADKLLIYMTLYINVALKRLEGCRTLAEGTKAIINLGLEKVPVPGESGFPFPGLFPLAQSQKTAEDLYEADKGGNKWKTIKCLLCYVRQLWTVRKREKARKKHRFNVVWQCAYIHKSEG